MTVDRFKELASLKAAIKDYEISTGIKCYFLDNSGKCVGNRSCYQCHRICEFVKPFDEEHICTHDYLGNCRPTLDTEEPQIYYCPYGFANIAVPVLPDEDIVYFVSAGPILLEAPGNQLLEQLLDCNKQLDSHYKDIRQLLEAVPILDDERARALGNTLQRSVSPLVNNHLKNYQKKNMVLTFLAQELRRECKLSLYPEFSRQSHAFQKELELLATKHGGSAEANMKALNMLVSTFIERIHKYDTMDETKSRSARFFLTLLQLARKYSINQEQIFGEQYVAIHQLLNAESFSVLNKTLYNTADRFQQVFFQSRKYKNNDLILQAMTYIREHYMEIKLQDVSAHVALNPSYLSDLFKKETGQSYSEYLNAVRVEASKQALREGQPLVQIAQSVGFSDQSYFIKVFKRYEGISPLKWKERI